MPTPEVIRRCRPDPKNFEFDVACNAWWTYLWVFYLILDPDVCRDALKMALDRIVTYGRKSELW